MGRICTVSILIFIYRIIKHNLNSVIKINLTTSSEHNTWEEVTQVSMTCKQLMDEFEKNLAKQNT